MPSTYSYIALVECPHNWKSLRVYHYRVCLPHRFRGGPRVYSTYSSTEQACSPYLLRALLQNEIMIEELASSLVLSTWFCRKYCREKGRSKTIAMVILTIDTNIFCCTESRWNPSGQHHPYTLLELPLKWIPEGLWLTAIVYANKVVRF